MVSLGLFVCVALVMVGSLRVQSDSQFASKPALQPPLSATGSLFPCIQSSAGMNQKKRVAVLHGPDWILESSIKLSCFPEREVVFSAEIGKQFFPHPFTARTKLWVTRDHDVTYVKIVDSSGSDKQDMIAVSFVTNHKCTDRTSKNCNVKGGAILVRM
jgi:hypothetical protein